MKLQLTLKLMAAATLIVLAHCCCCSALAIVVGVLLFLLLLFLLLFLLPKSQKRKNVYAINKIIWTMKVAALSHSLPACPPFLTPSILACFCLPLFLSILLSPFLFRSPSFSPSPIASSSLSAHTAKLQLSHFPLPRATCHMLLQAADCATLRAAAA